MERKTKNNDLNTLALPQAVFFLILVVFFFLSKPFKFEGNSDEYAEFFLEACI